MDELATAAGQAKRIGHVFRELADLDAEIATRDGLALAQRLDDRDGLLGGDGEADADVAAGGREDLAVDADHIAIHVEHRAAAVALIDRGVGLDEALAATGIAVERRDDAGGHRAADAEGIADGNHPVTHARLR